MTRKNLEVRTSKLKGFNRGQVRVNFRKRIPNKRPMLFVS